MAENIKKGVSIWGNTGTWNSFVAEEGYWLDGINRCTNVTGDYIGSGTGYSYSDDGLNLSVTATPYQPTSATYGYTTPSGIFKTANKLDITDKKSVVFEVDGSVSGVSWNWIASSSSATSTGHICIGLMDDNGTLITQYSLSTNASSKTLPATITLDTSNITGSYYIYIRVYSTWGTTGSGYRYAVILNEGGSRTQKCKVKRIRYETMPIQ